MSLYNTWSGMKERCRKHPNKAMCLEWSEDSQAFITWALANGYEEGLHIDKDIKCKEQGLDYMLYSPTTCSWFSQTTNSSVGSVRRRLGQKLFIDDIGEITAKLLESRNFHSVASFYDVGKDTLARFCTRHGIKYRF